MENENRSSMMLLTVLLIVLIGGALAFFLMKDDEPTSTNNNDDDTTTTAESKTFTLEEQNDSGQNGTAVLEEVGSQVRVTISLSSPTSVSEPAHIHNGNCPTPGAVVFPLTNVVGGSSVTMLDTDLDTLSGMGDLAINIHKSAEESSVYFACGDLQF